MKNIVEAIKEHLRDYSAEDFAIHSSTISLETDLIEEGIYDSMGFMELLSFLMEEYNKDIDLEKVDMEKITNIKYLGIILQ